MNTQIQGNWYNDSNGDCGYRSHYFFGSESLCNVTMLPTKHISYKKRCIKCLKSLETLKKIGPELYYSKSEYHSVKLGHKLKNKTKHKEFPLKTSNCLFFLANHVMDYAVFGMQEIMIIMITMYVLGVEKMSFKFLKCIKCGTSLHKLAYQDKINNRKVTVSIDYHFCKTCKIVIKLTQNSVTTLTQEVNSN